MNQSSSHSQTRGVDAGVWCVFEEVRRVPRRKRSGVLLPSKMIMKTTQCCSQKLCGCFYLFQTLHIANHKSYLT